MRSQFGVRSFLCAVWIIPFVLALPRSTAQSTPCASGSGKVCVLTWQPDIGVNVCAGCAYRTGQNLQENVLTPSSIVNDNFGQLCSVALDGQVYAQPLIVANVTIPNQGTFDVAYVATQNNTLYAINATPTPGNKNCTILLSRSIASFLPSGQQTRVSCQKIGSRDCSAIAPTVGILGTPVIQTNPNGGTIYLVTFTQDASGKLFYHYLHALDITTLTEEPNSPVLICPPGQTCPSGNSFSYYHIQRPGLLLANCGSTAPPCNGNNYVYVAFSMMDGYPPPEFPNGAMFGYDASNLSDPSVFYFQTTIGVGSQTSTGGGIWMGGAAPAFGPDAEGKNWIYLNTANGTFDLDQGGTDAGDSFLKLDPNGLQIQTDANSNTVGYLTPIDQYYRSAWEVVNGKQQPVCRRGGGDTDFGSGGVLLIPDNNLAKWPQLSVMSEKEGGLWFIDRNVPGQYQDVCSSDPCNCKPDGNNPSGNIQTYWTGKPYKGAEFRGGLAYWQVGLHPDAASGSPLQSYLFGASYQGELTRFPMCGEASSNLPMCGSRANLGSGVSFATGATPVVSAGGPQAGDALVWAIGGQVSQNPLPVNPGALYAFDAMTMTQLYTTNTCSGRDAIAPTTKFSVPTVANGFVYIGTEAVQAEENRGLGTAYIFGPNSGTCQSKAR